MSARPEFYEVYLETQAETIGLCRHCAAVLVMEGKVAGDPTLPPIMAVEVWKLTPRCFEIPCVIHEAITAFEAKRARLAAPPARIGEVRT